MLFDSDVLIFVQRGNTKAAQWIEQANERTIFYPDLYGAAQGAQHRIIKQFLHDCALSKILI